MRSRSPRDQIEKQFQSYMDRSSPPMPLQRRMPFRLAIFDLDGTLVDSLAWFRSVVNGVAREYGFRQIANHEIEPMRSEGPREILRRLEVPLWKLPVIARHMRALKREQLDALSLFPGVPAMLRRLHENGLPLALVTSDGEDN